MVKFFLFGMLPTAAAVNFFSCMNSAEFRQRWSDRSGVCARRPYIQKDLNFEVAGPMSATLFAVNRAEGAVDFNNFTGFIN